MTAIDITLIGQYDGQDVHELWLRSEGLAVQLFTLGAAVNRVLAADSAGVRGDVLLGHETLADKVASSSFFGDMVGPFANRIAGGRTSAADREIRIPATDRGQSLHSGPGGLHRYVWRIEERTPTSVRLSAAYRDTPESSIGPVDVTVEYRLSGTSLEHTFTATVEEPTVVNLTNHAYFNLSSSETVDDHVLRIPGSTYLPVDGNSIPLPQGLTPVAGTPFDLRAGVRLGDAVASDDPQVRIVDGFDHAITVDGSGLRLHSELTGPASGRRLTVFSDQPATQVYTGQGLAHRETGPGGRSYGPRAGVALETENYPDVANRPDLGTSVVLPGETYTTTTRWEFTVI